MQQLTGLDAAFLAMETPSVYGHVGSMCVLDPSTAAEPLTLERLTTLVQERLHLVPPFRRRLVPVPLGLDQPYWIEDPDFDLEFHVRELALPAPGDDRQLADQVARLVALPLDRARPLWELYVIHGLRGGRTALLTKLHHAAVDGMSGAEILSVLLDPSPEGRDVVPAPGGDGQGSAAPGELGMLARGVTALPRQPLRALAALPRTLPHLDSVPTIRHLPGVSVLAGTSRRIARRGRGGLQTAPRTRFQGAITPHRRV